MFLQQPNETPYDLNFAVLGFPVRINPLFFLMPLLLGGSFLQVFQAFEVNTGIGLILIVGVFLVSILVHELGHALAFRFYGTDSKIVLYAMGGLAIPTGSGWGRSRRSAGTPYSQIVISLAGPVAGLLLAVALGGIGLALGGQIEWSMLGIFPLPFLVPVSETLKEMRALWIVLWIGLNINVFWNVLNLMPVFPLDGGQIARQVFLMNDPWNGLRNATILSVVVGGAIAVWGLSRGDHFMGIMFGMLAFSNYQSISMGGGYGGGRPW